jgi:exodeoxyribonuclease V alpha subunit
MNLYKGYGEEALAAVRDNPYILVQETIGADFFEADGLALQLGFEEDCPQRIEAALLFELDHNLSNGHTFLPAKKLTDATKQLIGAESDWIEEALEALIESGLVIREPVAGQDACYLRHLFDAEHAVSDRIRSLAGWPADTFAGAERLISAVERDLSIAFASEQRHAVELSGRVASWSSRVDRAPAKRQPSAAFSHSLRSLAFGRFSAPRQAGRRNA